MAKSTKRQVAQTYDLLVAGGTVLEDVLTKPAQKQVRHRGVVPPGDLVELVGARAAVTLVKRYGGHYLPTHRILLAHLRIECIIRDYERGLTNQETLQAKNKCSHDTITRAVTEAKKRQRARTAERLAHAGPAEAFVHRITLGGLMAEYVTITVEKVVAATDKAFLVRVVDTHGIRQELWLPRSQMDDPYGLTVEDENEDVAVSKWFAEREELG